ncbi:FAD:protein FMN transferase [candidate division WWE3 bacterium]|uniref:FAD:protein FMN transferase n=1 Tax=candidate division WWE3 bacterium TaxID=2053526 RepID=A0A7X9DLI2_UNCKA|nr:FAD:protein FMN transferase [candidate division WWE3 bacterium]
MKIIERVLKNKIMATDVYICLASEKIPEDEMQADADKIIDQMKDFEQKYSRFIPNNYLSNLNESEIFEASEDLLELIEAGESYYKKTQGLFDPTIHNYLVNEGYNVSKNQGFYDKSIKPIEEIKKFNFSDININYQTKIIRKPKGLKIDFGGIGKGYIVDKTTKWVSQKYMDFCIDAGGDMFLGGTDRINKYPYWAIEIENPLEEKPDTLLPTLLVKDLAIATSGIGKRVWQKDGETKTHIIDPKTHKSVQNDLLSVTVIGNNTVYADIYAKTLLLLGGKDGLKYCNIGKIPAVFLTKFGEVLISKEMKKYVWQK